MLDEDDDASPSGLWWYAEWALDGESSGTEHSTVELREIVDSVVEGTRAWAHRGHTGRIRWHEQSDDGAPPIGEARAAAGIELPDRV